MGYGTTGTEYGLKSCTVSPTYECNSNTYGDVRITGCRELTDAYYGGSITCYSYYCNPDEGEYKDAKCYKYNQSSCASGWDDSVSYSCDDSNYPNKVGSYCYN